MSVTAEAFPVQIYLEKNTGIINNTPEVRDCNSQITSTNMQVPVNHVCPFPATVQLLDQARPAATFKHLISL